MDDAAFDRMLRICKLRLSGSERDRIKADIDNVISYFDTIESVDCDGYLPAYQPVDITPRTRKDKVDAFRESDRLLKNSKTYRFYMVGPKI